MASERTLEKGETLTDEGRFGHGLFAIEEGAADVQQPGTTIRSVGKGGRPAKCNGRGHTPLRVITFFKRDVWALEREAPEAVKRLRELLESRTMPPTVSG